MSEEVAALLIRLEATDAKLNQTLKRANRRFDAEATKMGKRAEKLDNRLSEVGSRFGVSAAVKATALATAIAAVGKVVSDVARNGDKFKLLESRFTALTGSAERGEAVFKSVLGVVQETGTAIDDVAGSVSRFTLAAEAIEATDDEVRQLTENVLKLGQVGGASNQELSSGATQLAQALASGRLQGDELRSILENMPLVAKAIADGLGVSVGQLRQMGADGELTARKVFDAILSKTEEIEDRFSQLPVTLDRAAGQLAGSWAVFTAELDKSLGVSEALVETLQAANSALVELSENRRKQAEFLARMNAPPEIDKATLTPSLSSEISQGRLNSLAEAADFAAVNEKVSQQLAREAAAGADDALARLNNSPLPSGRPGSSSNPLDLSKPGRSSRRRSGGGSRSSSVDTESAARMVQAIRDRVKALNDERGAIGLLGGDLERYRARVEAARIENELMKLASRENTVVSEVQAAEIRALANEYVVLSDIMATDREQLEAHNEAVKEADQSQKDLARSISSTADRFIGAVQSAESFEDALKKIGLQLLELAANAAFGQGPLGGLFNDLIGVGSNGLLGLLGSGGGSAIASAPALSIGGLYAKGGVFSGGREVTAFANGGVVSGPTTFPMPGGIGLMGEAGPEAIMPLSKARNGKLGVAAVGGGGGPPVVQYITNHIHGLNESQALRLMELKEREASRRAPGEITDRIDRGF